MPELVVSSCFRPGGGGSSVNGPPDAVPDMILVGQNELAHLNVLKNDVDPDGDELLLDEVTTPQHGYAAILNGAEELIYSPDHDFVGLDCEWF